MIRKTAGDFIEYRLLVLPLIVLFLCSCHFDEQPVGIEGSGARNTPPPQGSPPPASQGTSGATGTSAGPAIFGLNPHCAPVGAQAFTLSVYSWNLVASSVLRWNGTDLPSINVDTNAQLISAQIPASDVAAPGTAAITVFNPGSGPSGGSSSPMAFPVTTAGVNPLSIAVDPTGSFVYVANQGCGRGFTGTVSMYKIEPTGTLTSLGRVAAASAAVSIAIDPSGRFAYVENNGSVSTYTITPGTGVLALSGTTPQDVQAGSSWNGPWSITIDPSGRFAYLANSLANNISAYTIDSRTRALTLIGAPVQETGPLQTPFDGPSSVTVDPLGKFAYVAIQGDGGDMSSGSISVYRINSATGALTFASRVEGSCGAAASLCGPHAMAIDRSGKFAVAVGGYGGVSTYAIDAASGALTATQTVSAGKSPGNVALDPTGRFVYVTNWGSTEVWEYSMDTSTATLTSMGTVSAGSKPLSITIDPSGRFAYVANYGSNDISMYSIDPVTGVLTLIGTIGT